MKPKPLSELELEVMDIIWDCENCAIREVVEYVCKSKPLAYTTIATIMNRLVDKGVLKKRSEGLNIIYSPKMSKENFSKTVVQSFINKFFRSFGDSAIASFAQSINQLPKKKKEYFLQLLNEYEQKNK